MEEKLEKISELLDVNYQRRIIFCLGHCYLEGLLLFFLNQYSEGRLFSSGSIPLIEAPRVALLFEEAIILNLGD